MQWLLGSYGAFGIGKERRRDVTFAGPRQFVYGGVDSGQLVASRVATRLEAFPAPMFCKPRPKVTVSPGSAVEFPGAQLSAIRFALVG